MSSFEVGAIGSNEEKVARVGGTSLLLVHLPSDPTAKCVLSAKRETGQGEPFLRVQTFQSSIAAQRACFDSARSAHPKLHIFTS